MHFTIVRAYGRALVQAIDHATAHETVHAIVLDVLTMMNGSCCFRLFNNQERKKKKELDRSFDRKTSNANGRQMLHIPL